MPVFTYLPLVRCFRYLRGECTGDLFKSSVIVLYAWWQIPPDAVHVMRDKLRQEALIVLLHFNLKGVCWVMISVNIGTFVCRLEVWKTRPRLQISTENHRRNDRAQSFIDSLIFSPFCVYAAAVWLGETQRYIISLGVWCLKRWVDQGVFLLISTI